MKVIIILKDIKEQSKRKEHQISEDELLIYENIVHKFKQQKEHIIHNQKNHYDYDQLTKEIIEFNNYITMLRATNNMNNFRNEIIESSRDIIPAIDNIINRNFNNLIKIDYKIINLFKEVKTRYYDTVMYRFI